MADPKRGGGGNNMTIMVPTHFMCNIFTKLINENMRCMLRLHFPLDPHTTVINFWFRSPIILALLHNQKQTPVHCKTAFIINYYI